MIHQRQRLIFRSLLPVLIISYGGFLRFWDIDKNLIFADEIHTLKCAVEKSFFWIFTHFATQDSCIPLTLYNRLLLETIGLNEWLFRMPSLICGMALLFAVYHFMVKRFLPSETILVTGFLAISPYFVYMSREARPYMIVTLFIWVAFVLVIKWCTNRNASEIISAFGILAVAIYFHPVVFPTVIVIGLCPLFLLLYEKAPRQYWFQFAAAALLFVLIMVCLMVPSAMSLFNGISQKGAKGLAGFETIQDGLSLLHGLPIKTSIWLWVILLIPGIVSLYRRFPFEVLLILAAGMLQLAFLFAFQPRKMEIPWVWLRYVAHLLPWLIVGCVVGITSIISILNPIKKSPSLLVVCALVILVFFTSWHIKKRNYGIFDASSYNVHPMVLMVNKDREKLNNFTPVVDFYKKLPKSLSQGCIIEAPMLFTFPLYQFYQMLHGRNFHTAGVGPGYAQSIFNNSNGLKFKSVHRLSKSRFKSFNDRCFLIIHKRINEEMVSAYKYFCKDDIAFNQLDAMGYLFNPKVFNHMFGNKGHVNPDDLTISSERVYEDEWLTVFELNF